MRAKEVTLPGGGEIALQDEAEGKRSYVGEQKMRSDSQGRGGRTPDAKRVAALIHESEFQIPQCAVI